MNVLFLFIGLALGFGIGFLVYRGNKNVVFDTSALDAEILSLKKDLSFLQVDKERISKEKENLDLELKTEKDRAIKAEIRIAKAEEVFKSQEEKYNILKSELENIHKKYSNEFEIIANKILEEKSAKFTEQNKTNLDIILNPLKENIKRFEEQVNNSYKAESQERTTLKTEIKLLVERTQQISEQAHNLTTALKGDNKMQGNWGEHILENIFERSGLNKDQEYKKELSTTNEEGGRDRPDFIVYLPDNKHIIVDSKVSLVAYEKLVNSIDEKEREKYGKEHINSIRSHIKGLSEKNYQNINGMNTPDFVLLFIPIESSFSTAVKADNELFNYAWDKKIVLVSPSTLLATLRTIASIWKQDRQTKNAIEIAKQSGNLYDKFVGFIEDMEKIGKNIETSKVAYESAMNKLSTGTGNLIKRAQEIQKLGAKTTKQFPSKFDNRDSDQENIGN